MIELPNVTLCSVDTRNVPLTLRAIAKSKAHIRFGDVLLFTHESIDGIRTVHVDPFSSMSDFSWFMLTGLAEHVKTSHILVVHWDGYVLDPSVWTDSFLEYDYIGAEWPWHPSFSVGNGGFSLRSRKLLEALAHPALGLPRGVNEDEVICSTHRPILERYFGIRFAPVEVARRFSYEVGVPKLPTLGFHGVFNMWRHVPDDELATIVDGLPDAYVRESIGYLKLMSTYRRQRRFAPLRIMYRRWSGVCTPEQAKMEHRLSPRGERFLAKCSQMFSV